MFTVKFVEHVQNVLYIVIEIISMIILNYFTTHNLITSYVVKNSIVHVAGKLR